MREKKERQKALKSIIEQGSHENQEELLLLLKEQGFVSTQATLSRDLKELKIVKMHSKEGGYYYSSITSTRSNPETYEVPATFSGVLSTNFSGQFGVLKTKPGYASMIASLIDSSINEEIMGTIAGDDTLLILLKEGTDHKAVIEDLNKCFPGLFEGLF